MSGNDVTWLRWPEGASFDRKRPGSGSRRPKTGVYCAFNFLQGLACRKRKSRTGNDVMWPQMTGSNLEVMSFDRKSPGSECRRLKTCVYSAFDFLLGCSSQEEAVTWQDMTSRDLRWQEVIRKWCNLSGSHLEVAVEGQKLTYTVCLTTEKAATRRKNQSRDRKWHHVTSGDRKWLGSDVIWPEVAWKWMQKAEN